MDLGNRRGAAIGKSLQIILVMVILLMATTVSSGTIADLIGMGKGTEYHMKISQVAGAATLSSSFEEDTKVETDLPINCKRLFLKEENHAMGIKFDGKTKYSAYISPYFINTTSGPNEIVVNCKSQGGSLAFLNGKIEDHEDDYDKRRGGGSDCGLQTDVEIQIKQFEVPQTTKNCSSIQAPAEVKLDVGHGWRDIITGELDNFDYDFIIRKGDGSIVQWIHEENITLVASTFLASIQPRPPGQYSVIFRIRSCRDSSYTTKSANLVFEPCNE